MVEEQGELLSLSHPLNTASYQTILNTILAKTGASRGVINCSFVRFPLRVGGSGANIQLLGCGVGSSHIHSTLQSWKPSGSKTAPPSTDWSHLHQAPPSSLQRCISTKSQPENQHSKLLPQKTSINNSFAPSLWIKVSQSFSSGEIGSKFRFSFILYFLFFILFCSKPFIFTTVCFIFTYTLLIYTYSSIFLLFLKIILFIFGSRLF